MKYLVLTLFLSMGCGDAQETESSASPEKAQAIDDAKSKKKTTGEKDSTDKTLKKLKSKEIPVKCIILEPSGQSNLNPPQRGCCPLR